MAAPWRQALLQSIEANKQLPSSRFFQVATVRPDGRPANRTMVYQGFLADDSNVLLSTTDLRSRKVEDMSPGPAEVCWYFSESREQWRLGGKTQLVRDSDEAAHLAEARARAWRNMSASTRAWFAWPPPGKPRGPDGEFDKPAPSAEEPPPENFSLLLVDVDEVDHLQLRDNRRSIYKRTGEGSGDWQQEDVNP